VKLLLPAFLFSALCVSQAAQQPTEVPVENEPHHHLVFENEYVRVFKVEVAPHEATLVHRHKRDYVVVTIGDAEMTNAVVGKEAKKWNFNDGDVTFLEATGEKSFAHKAVNDGNKPFVNYTIELKKNRLMPDAPCSSWRDNQWECVVSSAAGENASWRETRNGKLHFWRVGLPRDDSTWKVTALTLVIPRAQDSSLGVSRWSAAVWIPRSKVLHGPGKLLLIEFH